MEKAKYNTTIQTCMEVFDFLIKNNLFVYDAGYDFLKSRISININGFIKETQNSRDNWGEKTKKELVPTIYVLNILMQNVEKALSAYDIPSNPDCNYAQINANSKKYKSYNEILNNFKKLKDFQSEVNDTSKYPELYVDFNFIQHPLELRRIECYAKLEKELKINTYGLLTADEFGYSIENFNRILDFDENGNPISRDPDLKFAKEDRYVNWDDFKGCIFDRYQFLLENGGFDIQEPHNKYKSVLGLEGKTK